MRSNLAAATPHAATGGLAGGRQALREARSRAARAAEVEIREACFKHSLSENGCRPRLPRAPAPILRTVNNANRSSLERSPRGTTTTARRTTSQDLVSREPITRCGFRPAAQVRRPPSSRASSEPPARTKPIVAAPRLEPARSRPPYAFRPRAAACSAWIAVRAIVKTMSSTRQPRLRSFTGFASPWSIGPIETTFALRCTAL
jgi:hypothetical protein